jgi:hypothetical protein
MRMMRDRAIGFRQSGDRTANPWLTPNWAGDRRRIRRLPCTTGAAFRQSQRKPIDVGIANLSTHGCTVKSAESQEIGARCWIILPTLESWSARVAWTDGELFGLEFSRPLHRAVAEMIVRRTEGRLPWSRPC